VPGTVPEVSLDRDGHWALFWPTSPCTRTDVMSSWARKGLSPVKVRRVKRLALGAALFLALTLPSLAQAEPVPGSTGATDSLLAVGADGLPRVAFVAADGSIVFAARAADGSWAEQNVPAAAGQQALVGLELAPAGAVLLVEATDGSRLSLAEQRPVGWQVRTIATAPQKGALGFGGLALGRDGLPLVAYASLLQTRKTFLRLVHEDASGRLIGEAVTRKGFPPSSELPTVTPVVLPSGAVRIVEAYSGAAIEWSRTKNRKDWAGQFLYANALAMPAGVARAVADPAGGVWSSWTALFPSYDESQVVLSQSFHGQHTTILSRHAFLVAIALPSTGPEVAADDYVDLEGARTVYAGLVLDTQGQAVELAGDLEGYAVDPSGSRHYLVLDAAGVEWYRSPTPPAATVELSASVSAAAFSLSGRVTGASGGAVEIWRETQTGAELLTTLPLGADGTFAFTDTPPQRPLTYRAIYRDANGLPLSSLVRSVLGA
jgi:hypothetical protein